METDIKDLVRKILDFNVARNANSRLYKDFEMNLNALYLALKKTPNDYPLLFGTRGTGNRVVADINQRLLLEVLGYASACVYRLENDPDLYYFKIDRLSLVGLTK